MPHPLRRILGSKTKAINRENERGHRGYEVPRSTPKAPEIGTESISSSKESDPLHQSKNQASLSINRKHEQQHGVVTASQKSQLAISFRHNAPITTEQLDELLELIKERYELDNKIWQLRYVRRVDRDVVEKMMVKADVTLTKIQTTIVSWDRPELFASAPEYALFEEIKNRIFEGGKRNWTQHPPWE